MEIQQYQRILIAINVHKLNIQTPITEMLLCVSEPLCRSGLPPVQMHFRNHCLDFPGKFSCAIDCFLELSCYIFKDAIACVECNIFFQMLYTACVQVIVAKSSCITELGLGQEPVCPWMRRCCPSLTDLSANAVL